MNRWCSSGSICEMGETETETETKFGRFGNESNKFADKRNDDDIDSDGDEHGT